MRPNNQNKRSRGRNNGSRKHSNPLSRNYESNGPDVKIRGNAAHIAEKYVQLARDAHASSDSVMAENYLQHAEHYFRIVSAAQAQQQQRNEQVQQQQPQPQVIQSTPDQSAGSETDESVEAEIVPAPVSDTSNDAEPVAGDEDSDDVEAEAEAEAEPRKPRERRPRRKPRVNKDSASNPSEAPQPDVGDLPAFLTGGGQTDAAE